MWRQTTATSLAVAATATARRALIRYCSSSSSHDVPFQVHGALTQLAQGELPRIGVEAHVTHAFSLADTTRFAALSGDSNPIHTDAAIALAHAHAHAPVVQGMLTASLFATIFGATVPGAVYVSQQLRWRVPLLIDERVCARIRVVRLRKRFVDCETVCERLADGAVVVEGIATVLLPSASATSSKSKNDGLDV